MVPTTSTLKRLFARSGNRCPFPKCTATLVIGNTLIGEVCHIRGEKPGAARYQSSQTDDQRQAYGNLIVMCPNHHTVIDADEEAYTVERILRMKADHESRVDAMTEEDAEQIASSVFKQNFSNIGQTGGIAAQNIHAQTFNFHHAVANDPAMQQRRIMAVEKLWTGISSIKKEFGDLIFVEGILTSAEIDGFFKNGWPQHFSGIKTYASTQAIVAKLTRLIPLSQVCS
jgi:hypothetical protein